MTPLEKIEKGIVSGDWQLVCDGYNKITNKKLTPPIEKPLPPPVKKLSSKKDYYAEIISMGVGGLDKIENYTLNDLKEMLMVYKISDGQKHHTSPQEENDEQPTLSGPLYISKPEKLLHIDKNIAVKVVPDKNFDLIKEPNNTNRVKREPPKKVRAECSKCSEIFNALAAFTFNDNGKTIGVCDVCKESR